MSGYYGAENLTRARTAAFTFSGKMFTTRHIFRKKLTLLSYRNGVRQLVCTEAKNKTLEVDLHKQSTTITFKKRKKNSNKKETV